MVKFINWVKHWLGLVLVLGVFMLWFYMVKWWSWLQATNGDTLTAIKWNEMANNQKAKFKTFEYWQVRSTNLATYSNDSNVFMDLDMQQWEVFYLGWDITSYTSLNTNPCIYRLIVTQWDCIVLAESYPMYNWSTWWTNWSTRIIIKSNSNTTCRVMWTYKTNAAWATCNIVNTNLYAYKIWVE